VMQKCCCNDW